MAFQITTPTPATLRTVTPRTELHGDEKVSAISLGLSIKAAHEESNRDWKDFVRGAKWAVKRLLKA